MPPLPEDVPCLSIGNVCDGLYGIGHDLTGSFAAGCGDPSQCSSADPIICKTAGGDKYDMWCNDDCESEGGVGCGGIGIDTLKPQCYTESVKKEVCQRLLQ